MFIATIKLEYTTSLNHESWSYKTVYKLQNMHNVENRIITISCKIIALWKWRQKVNYVYGAFFLWLNSPARARAAFCSRFRDHTQLHTTVGRTPMVKGSARRRDLCLRTHKNHKRQTSAPPAGFLFILSLYLIRNFCPDCPGFCFCPCCIRHLCLRQDSNQQSQQASLRLLGH